MSVALTPCISIINKVTARTYSKKSCVAAEDKNEFDKFMAQLSQKASNIAVEGDAHGR
jgi:hypothetical protein